MPIHPRFLKALKAMTKKYCKGKLSKKEGIPFPTCSKATSVFYATMKSKGIDYKKAPTEETIHYLDEIETMDVDAIIKWFEEKNGGV